MVGEEAGRPSQNRTVSAGNSVLLPANTRGSTGVMKMDGVGSGALQALQPRWCVGSSRPRDWSWAGRGGSSGTPGGAQDLPSSRAPPADKRHPGSGPGGFLVVSPAFSALQGLLEVVGESERPEAKFPVLASCPFWLPPLSPSWCRLCLLCQG